MSKFPPENWGDIKDLSAEVIAALANPGVAVTAAAIGYGALTAPMPGSLSAIDAMMMAAKEAFIPSAMAAQTPTSTPAILQTELATPLQLATNTQSTQVTTFGTATAIGGLNGARIFGITVASTYTAVTALTLFKQRGGTNYEECVVSVPANTGIITGASTMITGLNILTPANCGNLEYDNNGNAYLPLEGTNGGADTLAVQTYNNITAGHVDLVIHGAQF